MAAKEKRIVCDLCGQPVVLVPSARERAAKYGGWPSDYVKMFPRHAKCEVAKRTDDVRELMRRVQ